VILFTFILKHFRLLLFLFTTYFCKQVTKWATFRITNEKSELFLKPTLTAWPHSFKRNTASPTHPTVADAISRKFGVRQTNVIYLHAQSSLHASSFKSLLCFSSSSHANIASRLRTHRLYLENNSTLCSLLSAWVIHQSRGERRHGQCADVRHPQLRLALRQRRRGTRRQGEKDFSYIILSSSFPRTIETSCLNRKSYIKGNFLLFCGFPCLLKFKILLSRCYFFIIPFIISIFLLAFYPERDF
jgi:hypothetical protein